ncbi:hypothetical protein LshimejAT787_0804090 [Lyophyllum shimeji]|uniref:Uncharacterized protein n=1 Tax=Lyophyllum shimeji TaxID=47721 RepID=A0A9P3UPD0_LYOSH|nr:hypothetical protein LshimejAT787_0804090 [Lyophyllum shimeji]
MSACTTLTDNCSRLRRRPFTAGLIAIFIWCTRPTRQSLSFEKKDDFVVVRGVALRQRGANHSGGPWRHLLTSSRFRNNKLKRPIQLDWRPQRSTKCI